MAKGKRGKKKKGSTSSGNERNVKQRATKPSKRKVPPSAQTPENAVLASRNVKTVSDAQAELAAAQAKLAAAQAAVAAAVNNAAAYCSSATSADAPAIVPDALCAGVPAAAPAPTGTSPRRIRPPGESDFKRKCNWDDEQMGTLANLLEQWYVDKGTAPIANSEWEQFADDYNEVLMEKIEMADPSEEHKLRAQFRSAGALSKKVKAIQKSREASRTGVSHVPKPIAKISRVMKESANYAHVITIDRIYNNQNSGEDISDHEGSFDDNCDSGVEDDDSLIAGWEEKQTAKKNMKQPELKNTAKRNGNTKRRMEDFSSSASPKRRRSESTSSCEADSNSGNSDVLSTFLRSFSPQSRNGRNRPRDMMQPLMQMMMLKLFKDMVKNQ